MRSEGASTWDAFGGQKVRYEAGRMSAARDFVPRLLRRALSKRDASCFETAWFLITPPFALARCRCSRRSALALIAGGADGRRRVRRRR